MDNDATLFGFRVYDAEKRKQLKQTPITFTPPMDNDGAAVVEDNNNNGGLYAYGIGGMMASAINIAGPVKDEIMAIRKYRQMSTHHDCDNAIDDIVNEAIVHLDNGDRIVTLNLDKLADKISDAMSDRINEEFNIVLDLLDFNNLSYDIFRSWYVDGRLYYHKIIDQAMPTKGLTAVKRVDPVLMKKVRQITRTPSPEDPKIKLITSVKEFFVFNEQGGEGTVAATGSKISPEAITFVHSGMVDPLGKTIVGHLDKAYRPLNQVRMMEDSLVIYRLARAPERRVFNVDVGNLPPHRAEQYVQDLMNKYRNRLVYDAQTGEIQDNSHHMHVLEDFWLPKRADGRGTEVTTLQGGDNLGQMDDVAYFQKQLYRSLNVPLSRLEADQGFMNTRTTEITRDEMKFMKFIRRLQRQFSFLFLDILKTQLLLKKVVTVEEWNKLYPKMFVEFAEDSYFAEAQELDLIDNRLNILDRVTPYVGKYFSDKFVKNTILRQSDEEVDEQTNEIEQERLAQKWWVHYHPEEMGQDPSASPSFYGPVDYSNTDLTEPPVPVQMPGEPGQETDEDQFNTQEQPENPGPEQN